MVRKIEKKNIYSNNRQMSYQESMKKLIKTLPYKKIQGEIESLSEDISISTMTICFSFNTNLYIENISKWLKIDPDIVIAVGDRTLADLKKKQIPKKITDMKDLLKAQTKQEVQQKGKKRGRKPKIKNEKKKKVTKKKKFFNQISIKVIVPDKEKDRPVNIKLFDNGSVQMTGCVTIKDSFDAIYNCIKILNNCRAIVEKGKIKEVPFVASKLKIENIDSYKIGLINSKFTVPFHINRTKLHELMLLDEIDATYDRNVHASVIVKYEMDSEEVTTMVFEKGPVIITGAKCCQHVQTAYNSINKYLLNNYSMISTRTKLSNNSILQYLKE